MTFVRRLGGGLLWIVASLLGLVSVVLCVTVILLPLGLPLLRLSRRLFETAVKLWMPRSASHPVDELGKSARKKGRKARKNLPTAPVGDAATSAGKGLRKRARRARKQIRS